jgi:tetratricopeptide (TPR) repeat protein
MLNTDPCPCGSGLRTSRCCEADLFAAPDPASQELLAPKAIEATTLFNEKKHAEAAALALKILDLAPNNRAALRVLFEVRRAEGKNAATETLARRLAAIPAENAAASAAAHLQLAQLLVGQGRHLDAEPAARTAIKLSPRDATAHHVIGVVLTETGRLRGGEHHYRTSLRLLERDDGMVLANLAWNMKLQGRLDEAADLYKTALLLRPDNSRGVGGHAQVEAGRARLPEAAALLDTALTTWPGDRTIRLLRALVELQAGECEAVIARLDGPLESLLPPELAARGQAAARLGRITDAVAAFAIGRQMQRERYKQSYEPSECLKKAEANKAFFTADRIQSFPRAPFGASPLPIFLLGFPRSGSALLEQLLTKIPGFSPADGYNPIANLTELATRLAAMHAKSAEMPYPQALDDTAIGDGASIPARLRDHYLGELAAAGITTAKTKFVTDRAADNHWHLGLIKLLFPDAPIIHVIRHPLDIMLSNLGQDKKLEANAQVSMLTMARHYDFTMSLIKHFRANISLRYLPIRYENLTSNPAGTLKTILDFIGADAASVPRKSILQANEFSNTPRIPQHAILQEPLHHRGRYRYRDYERELPALFSEVRPILTPWIDELGYGDVQ